METGFKVVRVWRRPDGVVMPESLLSATAPGRQFPMSYGRRAPSLRHDTQFYGPMAVFKSFRAAVEFAADMEQPSACHPWRDMLQSRYRIYACKYEVSGCSFMYEPTRFAANGSGKDIQRPWHATTRLADSVELFGPDLLRKICRAKVREGRWA